MTQQNTKKGLAQLWRGGMLAVVTAFALASIAGFAAPRQAQAHEMPECNPGTPRCSPSIVTCNQRRPFLYWGVGGERGCVAALQGFLHEYGDYNTTPPEYYRGAIDGLFGPETHVGVSAFQGAHDLDVDGKVGYYTWTKIHGLCAFIQSNAVGETCNENFSY